MNQKTAFLEHIAYNIRASSIAMTTAAGSGHLTSALSAADMMAVLFFHAMQLDVTDAAYQNNDRFVLSKGHASPVLYAVYKELGILTAQELQLYRSYNSPLEGHPTPRFSWVDAATGSLGQGLSIGLGMAFAARMSGLSYYTYVLLGDSELSEGQVWEAVQIAAHYRLNNVIALVDVNRLGQVGPTMLGHDIDSYSARFSAFGWQPIVVDGHDIVQLIAATDRARQSSVPVVILARTYKGCGVATLQDVPQMHGHALSVQDAQTALVQLRVKFASAAAYTGPMHQPHKPKIVLVHKKERPLVPVTFESNKPCATRQAYGQALVALAGSDERVVVLDAEVSNSTYAFLVKEKFPERFIECFIAEQNMVSMAVGLSARGYIPYVSTFAAFFSRAYDQIRMAAIGRARLCLVGSHAGVSIGQDGPSQMGLEDIAIMRAIPDSVVLQPADAISTVHLLSAMHAHTGISYMRTMRQETPCIYDAHTLFKIGGSHVLVTDPSDLACILATGATVHEALRACEQLRVRGISVCVIDVYSIKPLDIQTIVYHAQRAHSRVITVEDHYIDGGMGQAVAYQLRNMGMRLTCLAVTHVPRSATSSELLSYAGIDAQAIVAMVEKLIS